MVDNVNSTPQPPQDPMDQARQESVIKPLFSDLYKQSDRANTWSLVAIIIDRDIDTSDRFQGTGCLIYQDDVFYIVTCSHVLSGMSKHVGDEVTVRPLESAVDCRARVIHSFSSTKSDDEWEATEDIAILEMIYHPFFDKLYQNRYRLLSLSSEYPNQEYNECVCWGYPTERKGRIKTIKDITCYHLKRGENFHLLFDGVEYPVQSKDSDLFPYGMSGAPIRQEINTKLIGIFQATWDEMTSYYIPSYLIHKALQKHTSNMNIKNQDK